MYLDGGAEELTLAGATVTGRRYYPAPDATTVVRSSGGAISYQIASPTGTAVEAINAASDAVSRRYFDPYGSPVGTSPAWPDAHAFAGQPADPATFLGLLGARQYDPATGRFLSLDPLFQAGSPQQMGGYAYAASNPVTRSDPSGLFPGLTCGGQPCPAPGSGGSGGHGGSGGGGNDGQPGPGSGSGSSVTSPSASAVAAAAAGLRASAAGYYIVFVATYQDGNPYARGAQQVFDSLYAFCGSNQGLCGAAVDQQLFRDYVHQPQVASLAFMGNGSAGAREPADTPHAVAEQTAAQDDVSRLSCGQSFTPATRVLLATGTTIAIRRLKPGDQVLAYDTATGRSHAQQVTAVLIHHDHDLFNLVIETRHRRQVIHATGSHLFWNPAAGTWAKAATLARGTRLATPARATIVTVTGGHFPRDHSGWMWDLTITTDHDFYISVASTAVLVHNCNTPEDTETAAERSTAVIGRVRPVNDTAVAKAWPGHEVLDLPSDQWSVAKNDAWVQSVIDRKMDVFVASNPNLGEHVGCSERKADCVWP